MRILIVDDYDEVRALIGFSIDTFLPADVDFADSGNQAIEIIKSKSDIDLIISDVNMAEGTGLDLYRFLKFQQLNIPFVLMTCETIDHYPLLKGDPLVQLIRKPYAEEELQRAIELFFFDKQGGQNINSAANYIPVHLNLLKQIGKIEVPLYVKINETKFIKLTQEQTEFTDEQYEKYHSKGVTHFFVESENSDHLIHEFKKKVLANEAWNEVPVETSAELISFNTELLKSLSQQLGWSPKLVDLAKQNSQKALSIAKTNTQMSQILRQFQKIERYGHSDHCTLLILVSCGLAEKLGIGDDLTLRKLTFASLFHDMTLTDSQFLHKKKILRFLEQRDIESRDASDVHNHPSRAAEICRTWDFCPPEVDQIILNHHEQSNGNGFPNGMKADELDLISTLFIVAEDFAHFYIDHSGRTDPQAFQHTRRNLMSYPKFKRALNALVE